MNDYFFTERGLFYRTNSFTRAKKTILFVHGVSGSSSAWLTYEAKFKDHYNIISFDLRGHGKSQKPTDPASYAIPLFADDIKALLDYLHIKQCILISHSFGSVIALAFLEQNQKMIEGVILLSPQYSVNAMPAAKLIKPFVSALVRLLPHPKSHKPASHIDYSRFSMTGDWNIPRTIADVRNTGFRTYLYCVRQTYNFDGAEFLNKINVPVLIIHGRNDSIFPVQYAETMHETISHSDMVIIDSTDHILVLNNFSEVSRLIEGFVEKIARGAQ
jgi:pimeloyl-ACP methyl ester carboxylesterase